MSARDLEALLARLYGEPGALGRFCADPDGMARAAGLSPEECAALQRMDFGDLHLAARSFARKRAAGARRTRGLGFDLFRLADRETVRRWFPGGRRG